jgi:hypothetical protein
MLPGFHSPLPEPAIILTVMPAGSAISIMASLYSAVPEEGSAVVFLFTLFSRRLSLWPCSSSARCRCNLIATISIGRLK